MMDTESTGHLPKHSWIGSQVQEHFNHWCNANADAFSEVTGDLAFEALEKLGLKVHPEDDELEHQLAIDLSDAFVEVAEFAMLVTLAGFITTAEIVPHGRSKMLLVDFLKENVEHRSKCS